MEVDAGIHVQLVYAEADSLWQKTLRLPADTTVGQALTASLFATENPAYPRASLRVGIFGQECSPDRLLVHGDRIEVYRPLVFDPMESRRRRAVHRKAFMTRAQKPAKNTAARAARPTRPDRG